MNLKNYTSTVSYEKSISFIETKLISIGAKHIAKSYDENGIIDGFSFQLYKDGIPSLIFKLPSKWKLVEKYMYEQIRRPRKHTKFITRQQALRTAFKLLSDWVAIQVSMIQLEQVEAAEVFLPYAYDMQKNQTLFEKFKQDKFKQLTQ